MLRRSIDVLLMSILVMALDKGLVVLVTFATLMGNADQEIYMNMFGINMVAVSLIRAIIDVATVLVRLRIASRNVTKTIVAKATLHQLGATPKENVILQPLRNAHQPAAVTMIHTNWDLYLLAQHVEAIMVDAILKGTQQVVQKIPK